VLAETPKAWRIQLDDDDQEPIWVPKSVGEIDLQQNEITLPTWFIDKNEIEADPIVKPAFRRSA
jgi:hypothetical protein